MSLINSPSNRLSFSVTWANSQELAELKSRCKIIAHERTEEVSSEEELLDATPEWLGPGRYYTFKYHEVVEGKNLNRFMTVPSVTTFLSSISDQTWLEEWRANVGDERADHISRVASGRGSEMHDVLENLLNGGGLHKLQFSPLIAKQIPAMIRTLSLALKKVYFTEHACFSPTLKLAGRTDLVAEIYKPVNVGKKWLFPSEWLDPPETAESELSVVDYKTSNKKSGEFDPESETGKQYVKQCMIYAHMLNWMYQMGISSILILIAHPDGFVTKIYKEIPSGVADLWDSSEKIKKYPSGEDKFDKLAKMITEIQPMTGPTGYIIPVRPDFRKYMEQFTQNYDMEKVKQYSDSLIQGLKADTIIFDDPETEYNAKMGEK